MCQTKTEKEPLFLVCPTLCSTCSSRNVCHIRVVPCCRSARPCRAAAWPPSPAPSSKASRGGSWSGCWRRSWDGPGSTSACCGRMAGNWRMGSWWLGPLGPLGLGMGMKDGPCGWSSWNFGPQIPRRIWSWFRLARRRTINSWRNCWSCPEIPTSPVVRERRHCMQLHGREVRNASACCWRQGARRNRFLEKDKQHCIWPQLLVTWRSFTCFCSPERRKTAPARRGWHLCIWLRKRTAWRFFVCCWRLGPTATGALLPGVSLRCTWRPMKDT